MKSIAVCFLLIASNCLAAQDLLWYEGSIVLQSGKVMTGKISMAPGQNLILFTGGTISIPSVSDDPVGGKDDTQMPQAIPAHKLRAVFYYDEGAHINRRFVSVAEDTSYPVLQLYEVVLNGPIDVLRRPKGLSMPSAVPDDFNYFCRALDKMVPLRKFYREIYPKLEHESRQHLIAFIKANNLEHGDDATLISIIAQYNKMARNAAVVARY